MIQTKTSRLRVITVDDSRIVSQRLETLLKDIDGVSLEGAAGTIADALAIIENQRPHVIILDIHLSFDKPRNGIDLLNLVRKVYPVIKVVMLTNLTDHRYKTLCLGAGADFFLDKSNDFERIPEILNAIYNEGWIMECESWWNEQQGGTSTNQ